MVNKGKIVYECVVCGMPTKVLHEVFFGTHARMQSVKHNIQVPLCVRHHNVAHGRLPTEPIVIFEKFNQEECISFFCGVLGIDKWKTRLDLNNMDGERRYLKEIETICLDAIKRHELCY